MVDIEAKSLAYLKNNLHNLNRVSADDIKKLLSNVTYIESWTIKDRLNFYIDITCNILTNYDINEIQSKISFLIHQYSPNDAKETNMFYALVSDYNEFLKKIYDIYLLDQILYILQNIHNFNNLDVFNHPFRTNSNYEYLNYGLGLVQEAMDSNSFYEQLDFTLFKIKMYYLDKIKELLKKEEYQMKLARLKEIFKTISCNSNNQSWYASNMFIGLLTLIKYPKNHRALTRKKSTDNNQFTLF